MNNQNIANFLKQLRKTANLSVIDVAGKLRQCNIEISSKTLYGYESGLSMPNADVFVALCKIYNCDNPMDIFPTPSFKSEEISLINKYRNLDEHGKEMVDFTLTKEWERSMAGNSNIIEYDSSIPNAAHVRTDKDTSAEEKQHDENIMDDKNF